MEEEGSWRTTPSSLSKGRSRRGAPADAVRAMAIVDLRAHVLHGIKRTRSQAERKAHPSVWTLMLIRAPCGVGDLKQPGV